MLFDCVKLALICLFFALIKQTHQSTIAREKEQLDIELQQQQQLHADKNNNSNIAYEKSYDINAPVVVSQQQQQHKRQKREFADWLIAPNTKWCGRGNTANGTYNELGGASSADKCCRRHDHCQIYIPGMSNRYQLFNYRPYTLSHCSCDRRFRTCLKMANDEDANTIGKLFFNMVQTHCFVISSEKVCTKRNPADGKCEHVTVKQKAHLKSNKRF